MMTKEESSKIVNGMTPRTGVLVLGQGQVVKMEYFFSSSCLQWGMDQTNKVYSNDDQRRIYQIINFMNHGAGVLMLWHNHISHYALSSTLSIYSTLIVITQGFSNVIVDFYLFYVWSIDMHICALLTRSRCSLWYSGGR